MMMAAIDKKLELDRSIEDVWRALTDPAEVAGWFGDTASFAPELGGEGWFGWESLGRTAMAAGMKNCSTWSSSCVEHEPQSRRASKTANTPTAKQ